MGCASSVNQMPSYNYKLTYFNVRGRGECARLLFAAAGVSYEDHRIEFADWPALKNTMPLGTLPILKVDGKTVVQSYAVYRHLAREFGMYGNNAWETTRIDMITETLQDIRLPTADIINGQDEEKKKEQMKKLFGETGPRLLGFLEETLNENENGNSFFVGNNITLADLVFFEVMDMYLMKGANENGLDKFPKLKALKRRIAADKNIAAWLAKRPETLL